MKITSTQRVLPRNLNKRVKAKNTYYNLISKIFGLSIRNFVNYSKTWFPGEGLPLPPLFPAGLSLEHLN